MIDLTNEIINGHDSETHRSRGKHWDKETKADDAIRRRQAVGMFFEKSERNTVFRIARITCLPIPVVRDIEESLIRDGAL